MNEQNHFQNSTVSARLRDYERGSCIALVVVQNIIRNTSGSRPCLTIPNLLRPQCHERACCFFFLIQKILVGLTSEPDNDFMWSLGFETKGQERPPFQIHFDSRLELRVTGIIC